MAHTSRCSASTKPDTKCECSCAGSQHGPSKAGGEGAVKPGYQVPHPYKEGEAHRPPAVAPTPDRTLGQHLLDIVVAIWHLRHGEVTDTSGIPESELVRGMTVKQLMILELTADAQDHYGKATTVRIATDVGVDRVAVHVTGADGRQHVGYCRAERDRWGCLHHQEMTWDPPTVTTTAATPALSWALGMTGAAVTKVPRPAATPTKPATDWTAGMRG